MYDNNWQDDRNTDRLMKRLHDTWFIEGDLDFERNKYILLGYLQHTQSAFRKSELYPHVNDLVKQLRLYKAIIKQKNELVDSAENERLKLDLINGAWNDYLNFFVEYASPRVRESLVEGKQRRSKLLSKITLDPVGIEPLYKQEGYVFLSRIPQKQYSVYRFKISKVLVGVAPQNKIHLSFVKKARYTFSDTFERQKVQLAKQFKELPNPLVYYCSIPLKLPLLSAVVPLLKIKLVGR